MKKINTPLSILLLVALSCISKDDHAPDTYFDQETQRKIISQTVRYAAKLAPHSNHETKFQSEFDDYYKAAAELYDFRRCYPIAKAKGEYFYLMTRSARSIWPAREALGGTLKVDANNKLIDYSEEFRTWKMADDSLNARAFELFDRMVKEEDLTSYRSKFKGDRYIEFPDDRYYFNKKEKQWKDSFMDSIR